MIDGQRLRGVLDERRCLDDLRRYFGQEPGEPAFSGSWFNTLPPNERDRITAADIVAVQCLSVTVPVEVTLDLLEGGLGTAVNGLLADIPDDVGLGDDKAAALIVRGGPGRPGVASPQRRGGGRLGDRRQALRS